MIDFYKNLRKGKSKNEALRLAKLTYLNQNSNEALNHPYYWSGFVINGNTDPTSGFAKQSFNFTLAYATMAKDWIVKASINHSIKDDNWGRNFPATDIFTVELIHVIP